MSDSSSNDVQDGPAALSISASRGLAEWLGQHRLSLAVTTYQVGKLLFFGLKPDGKLWVFNRNIGRCLGLAARDRDLWVTADTQIFRFVDALQPGQVSADGQDALYVPQMSYFTGDLDVHDMAVAGDGKPVFVNTLFNCLARVDETHSFRPLWRPPFVSQLVAEDRCHLNGLAMVGGEPGYVTAVAESDTFDGWRDQRQDGGIAMDARTGEIVSRGLSMPHSPRVYRDRLWLHNSGRGEFGHVDLATGRFEPLCFCPGYLRGLDFVDRYAVVGLSRPRKNQTFSGLPLDAALAARKVNARCGIYVIDMETGAIAHSLVIDGVISELYDVVLLHGRRQPAALGPSSPDVKRTISIG